MAEVIRIAESASESPPALPQNVEAEAALLGALTRGSDRVPVDADGVLRRATPWVPRREAAPAPILALALLWRLGRGIGEATTGVVVACYVDPAMIRRGVGSAIMEHALVIARRGHDGPIRVEATLNAAPFYARFGFGELARATLRRGEVDVPYVLMARP